MEIKLSKKFDFEGKEYESLDLKLDELTGHDILSAEREATAVAGRAVSDFSKTYQAAVAARAAGVPVDMIIALPAKDFVKITLEASSFLLGD